MKICECGSPVLDDESGHTEPERDRHAPRVVSELPYVQGDPPDPRERAVAEAAADILTIPDHVTPESPRTPEQDEEFRAALLSDADRDLL